MSTRGLSGFRSSEIDKLQYINYDTYPTGLGLEMLSQLRAVTDWESVQRHIDDLVPAPDEHLSGWQLRKIRQQVKPFHEVNARVGQMRESYDLFRPLQHRLDPYLDGSLQSMHTYNEFILDSIWCRWGYIANLDSMKMEVWKGSQHEPDPNNRYGSERLGRHPVYPCKQVKSWDLNALPSDEVFLSSPRRYDISSD